MAQGRKAGRAYVELGVDDKLTKGLDVAGEKLKAFGDSVKSLGVKLAAIGGAGVGGLLAASKVFADVGSEVFDMTKRTGLSAEAVSELGYVASQAGVEMAGLEGGVKKMQKALGEAAYGSAESVDAFDNLGLSVLELLAMSPEKAFTLVGDRISAIQNPTMRAAAAMKVFGKSGADLLPMLEDGADGLSKMRQEARDLGLSLSTKSVAAADELGDAYGRLGATIKTLAYQIGAQLAPELTGLANASAQSVAGAIKWVTENRELVLTAMKLSLAIGSVGAALIAVGGSLGVVGMAFTGLSGIIAGLATLGGTLATVFAAIGAPVVALSVGVGVVAAGFLHFSGALEAAESAAGRAANGLSTDFDTALEGITLALQRGDVESATKIMMLGAKSAMTTVLGEMKSAWTEFTTGLAETVPVAGTTLGQMWEELKGEANAKWFEVSGQLHSFNHMVNAWSLGGTLKGMNKLGIGGSSTGEWGNGDDLDRYFRIQARDAFAGFGAKAFQARKDAQLASDAVVNDTVNNAPEVGQQLMALGDEANNAISKINDEIAAERQKLKDAADAERWKRDRIAPDRAAKQDAPKLFRPWWDPQAEGWHKKELAKIVTSAPEVMARIGSTGTFNADAALSLQASSGPMQRIAKAAERTAENTKRIEEKIENVASVYGE